MTVAALVRKGDGDDQRHVDRATELDQYRVQDEDAENELREQHDVRCRIVIDRDQSPFRSARLERDAGQDRSGYEDERALQCGIGQPLPGRDEHVKRIEPDVDHRYGRGRPEHPPRPKHRRRADALKEIRDPFEASAPPGDPGTDHVVDQEAHRQSRDEHGEQGKLLRIGLFEPGCRIVLRASGDRRQPIRDFMPDRRK